MVHQNLGDRLRSIFSSYHMLTSVWGFALEERDIYSWLFVALDKPFARVVLEIKDIVMTGTLGFSVGGSLTQYSTWLTWTQCLDRKTGCSMTQRSEEQILAQLVAARGVLR